MQKAKIKIFHQQLSEWYQRRGRQNLPWRQTDDAYRIYISEIMLQQTQVKTVLERFYFPFLEAFPTIQALAKAPEDAVMKQWEGLGYYSRARNLHKAAKHAAPHLPNSYDALMALPGIGRNTAHAILAFAFRKPYPVLEANVKRLMHRIFALKERDENQLWQHAETLLNRDDPFDYNQAMMDLGAMICLPKAPLCDACPAHSICAGKNDPLAYPVPKTKNAVPVREKILIALRDANGRYHLTPRTTRFLGGLYGFIELDKTSLREGKRSAGGEAISDTFVQMAIDCVVASLHSAPRNDDYHVTPLGLIEQTYSHFKLKGTAYLCELPQAMNGKEWFSLEEIQELPLSGADKKLLALLN